MLHYNNGFLSSNLSSMISKNIYVREPLITSVKVDGKAWEARLSIDVGGMTLDQIGSF